MNYNSVREFLNSKSQVIPQKDLKTVMEILDKAEAKEMNFNKQLGEELKIKGNEAFKSGELERAIDLYTQAIQADPQNALLYSNRSLVYSKIEKDKEAIDDCLIGVKLDPTFIKFYIRLAMIYMKTDKQKAHEYIKKGLEYEPDNKLLLELEEETGISEKTKDASPASMFKGFDTKKLGDLLKDEKVQSMVKDFVKDKSPGELAEMMKKSFGSFK